MVDVANKRCKYNTCGTRSKPGKDFCEIHTYKEVI